MVKDNWLQKPSQGSKTIIILKSFLLLLANNKISRDVNNCIIAKIKIQKQMKAII